MLANDDRCFCCRFRGKPGLKSQRQRATVLRSAASPEAVAPSKRQFPPSLQPTSASRLLREALPRAGGASLGCLKRPWERWPQVQAASPLTILVKDPGASKGREAMYLAHNNVNHREI